MSRWGIDIGGTKIGVACGDAGGNVIASKAFPTDLDANPHTIIDRAITELKSLDSAGKSPDDVEAVGVCCPGPFDYATQTFLQVPNMPRWAGFDLSKHLNTLGFERSLGMNDANALALAEWHQCQDRGIGSLVYFTMSTGMGAGIVIDGEVLHGSRGFAGEIGRIQLAPSGPAGFGRRGTAEGFLSGGGLVQEAGSEVLAAIQRGEETALERHFLDRALDAKTLCEASAAGDSVARSVTDATARKLGELVAILTCVIEPDEFVLGTIGSAHPDLFVPIATERARELVIPPVRDTVTIRPTALENKSAQSALALAQLAVDRQPD